MTCRELFEIVIPRILQDNPERGRDLGAAIAFDISGPGGGTWVVDALATPALVSSARTSLGGRGVECTVHAEISDFEAMLAEPSAALQLFQERRIRITGDAAVATRFHRLFR